MWAFIWDPERSELTNIKIAQVLNVLQFEKQVWAKGADQEKHRLQEFQNSWRELWKTELTCVKVFKSCSCIPTDEYSHHHMSKNFLLQQIKVCLDLFSFFFEVKMKSHFSPVFSPWIPHNSQPITFLQIHVFFLH